MPVYGYRCEKCGKEFEFMMKMGENFTDPCPGCGGILRKLLYPTGVIFKGTGFYHTDYGKGKKSDSPESCEKKESGSSSCCCSDGNCCH